MKQVLSLSVLPFAFLLVACSGDGSGPSGVECESGLLAGDLVITEVLANPEGDDEGREYFEIYNATGNSIDLTGLTLIRSNLDESRVQEHTMTETLITSGGYLALGGILPEFRPPYIGYGYGDDLGSMVNGGGILTLRCGETVVDTMTYSEATSGRSLGLDGAISPDHLANDDLANFCDATTEFDTDSFGSPGVANEPCGAVEQTTCNDGGTVRDVIPPTAGQLIFTEFMANPAAVEDNVGEWLELKALDDFDLNGVGIGKTGDAASAFFIGEDCLKVTAGDRILVARSTDPLVNGGLPTPDFTFSFSLKNSETATGTPGVFAQIGDTVLDEISWTSSSAGKSTSLDPGSEDATANDIAENYCPGRVAYGAGDEGTPRAENSICDTSGMCMDKGGMRATVPPLAADVTITEFMPDPDAVGDTVGEFFEVHFAADADLNGLQLGKEFDPTPNVLKTLNSPNCIRVAADTFVVFARNVNTEQNGGLPTENIFDAGIGGMSQTNDTDFGLFVAIGGAILDSITYNGSDITPGSSRQRDGEVFCDSTSTYGAGDPPDRGTPGAANDGGCPLPPE